MELFGTTTSPYVRRVRILLHELGLDFQLTNTATETGQQKLRSLSPLWKVPTLVAEDQVIWDSHTIIDWLMEKHGAGNWPRPTGDARYQELNLITAADAVLDSGINVFYIKKDGGDPAKIAYLDKQVQRVGALLDWLQLQLEHPVLRANSGYNYASVALVSALDWLEFRKAYDLSGHAILLDFAKKMQEHIYIKETYPAT